VRVEASGAELGALTGVVESETGLTVRLLPAAGEAGKTTQTLEVAVAPDAPLGKHELRVFDRTGASNPKYFWVGELPEVAEREPNNDWSEAQHVTPPVTVHGAIGANSDVDTFAFQAKKGEAIACEIQSLRLLGNIGDSWLKGYLEVRDAAGKVLGASDGYYRWDPYVEFVAPADGLYRVQFHDIQFRGAPTAVYRLTIGAVPHAWSLFPMGGQRGTTVRARFTGINLGPEPVKAITLPKDEPLGLREERLAVGGLHTNGLKFRAEKFPDVEEVEPNDRPEQANRVAPPVVVNGRLDRDGDVDSYRFTAAKGERIVFQVLSRRAELPTDSFLVLRDAAGKQLAEADDGAGERDSRLDWTFQEAGEYVIQVRDIDDRGGPDFVYRLSLLPPQPDFQVQAQNDKPVVAPGQTVAIPVNVTRQDGFAGEVRLEVEGLPPGFSAPPVTVAAGQKSGTLKISAPAGAPHAAIWLRLWGEAEIDGQRERRPGNTTETYNIQGTAFRRDLAGPLLVVTGS
jgi:hypothetical protein